jgi:two-component system LytT family response regulator
MNTVLIDDEPLALKSTFVLLQDYCPMVKVVGMARDIEEGREMLERLTPDLVLCDIEMPGGSGFDLLDQFPKPSFQIIFITAYDHYAIKAFEYSAIDYLLKPYTSEKLVQAIAKALAQKSKSNYMMRLEALVENKNQAKKLVIQGHHKTFALSFNSLCYLKADSNYTKIVTIEGTECISTKTLKHYVALLPENWFFRIHHSYLVHRTCISSFDSKSYEVHLKSGTKLNVSHRRSKEFSAWLKKD